MTPVEENTYWNIMCIPILVVYSGGGSFFLTLVALSLDRSLELGFYLMLVQGILFVCISAYEIYRPYRWILMDREVVKKNGKN